MPHETNNATEQNRASEHARRSMQRLGRPLAWPELTTSKWKLTWKIGWRSWRRWKLSRHYYGWTAELPWLVVMFTRFAKRPTDPSSATKASREDAP